MCYACVGIYTWGENIYNIYYIYGIYKERKKKEYYQPAGRRLMLCRRLRLVGTLCSQESRPRLYISTKDLIWNVVAACCFVSLSFSHGRPTLSLRYTHTHTRILTLTFGPLPVDDCNAVVLGARARGTEQYYGNMLLAYYRNPVPKKIVIIIIGIDYYRHIFFSSILPPPPSCD